LATKHDARRGLRELASSAYRGSAAAASLPAAEVRMERARRKAVMASSCWPREART